jgi:hypothetical protein
LILWFRCEKVLTYTKLYSIILACLGLLFIYELSWHSHTQTQFSYNHKISKFYENWVHVHMCDPNSHIVFFLCIIMSFWMSFVVDFYASMMHTMFTDNDGRIRTAAYMLTRWHGDQCASSKPDPCQVGPALQLNVEKPISSNTRNNPGGNVWNKISLTAAQQFRFPQ